MMVYSIFPLFMDRKMEELMSRVLFLFFGGEGSTTFDSRTTRRQI